ncbi:MAG: hypothetical protein R3C68_13315 [Myxococcota bacterium]
MRILYGLRRYMVEAFVASLIAFVLSLAAFIYASLFLMGILRRAQRAWLILRRPGVLAIIVVHT